MPTNPDVVISPIEKKSICASNPDEDLGSYHMEKITQREAYELHVPLRNLSHKVAYSMAIPTAKGDTFHGDAIPSGYSRVTVDDVIDNYEDLDLDIPRGDDVTKLGQATHGIILWQKRYIVLTFNQQPSPVRETSLPNEKQKSHTTSTSTQSSCCTRTSTRTVLSYSYKCRVPEGQKYRGRDEKAFPIDEHV